MKYIKLFEELTKVTSYRSQSGNTKHYDTIYNDENPDIKSAASGILLRDYYAGIETADINKLKEAGIPIFSLRNKPAKLQKLLVTLNNFEFLAHKLKEDGILKCEYCNEGPLILYNKLTKKNYGLKGNKYYKDNISFNSDDGATCDHKVPQSKGGDKFDFSNLAVCCHDCNQKKGPMSYEDWMARLKESIITNFKFFK